MSFSQVWSDALEAVAADSDYGSTLGDVTRKLHRDVRERMQVEHNFSTHGGGTDDGTHKAGLCGVAKVDTTVNLAALGNVANASGFDTTLYQPVYNSGAAWVPYSVIPTGAKTVWYSDTALTGWTLDDTMDDKVLFVTKGSVAGGETGGGAHSAGTWTQDTLLSHNHEWFSVQAASVTDKIYNQAGTLTTLPWTGPKNSAAGSLWATGSVSGYPAIDLYTSNTSAPTSATWRPAAYCFTVQSKN